MHVRDDLLYTKTHEWVRIVGSTATVGITDHAQEELGDVVYVELPEPGADLQQGEAFGSVESVKAVSDLYAPVGGVVAEVNQALNDRTELVNQDPYGEGWMLRLTLPEGSETDHLLKPDEYQQFLQESGH